MPRKVRRVATALATASALATAAPLLTVGLQAFWHSASAVAQAAPSRVIVTSPGKRASGTEVSVSPTPGSRTAPSMTQISFVGVAPSKIGQVTVTGSVTGSHAGRLMPYSQGDGASFVPTEPFAPGELVTVKTDLIIADAPTGTFHFAIATPATLSPSRATPLSPSSTARPWSPAVRTCACTHYVSRPDLLPPTISVKKNLPGTAPGYVFLAPVDGAGQTGPMIANSNGTVVWWDPIPHLYIYSFRVQRYQEKPVLTWWQGGITDGHASGEDVIVNSSYHQIATVRAGNGLSADDHDFVIYPNGTAFITVTQPIMWNLSSVGGPKNAPTFDSIAQEIDVKTGLVRFQWDALDHVALNQTYSPYHPPNENGLYDYFHINSANLTSGGDLLISGRQTCAVYEIDLVTGRTIWTLGGKASSFVMGPGTAFAFQHDAEPHPNGTISVFDDELPPSPPDPQARGLILSLDLRDHTASLVRQFDHSPPLSTPAKGNLQELSNGDVMIGWGSVGYLTEYSGAGAVLLDAKLPASYDSYRAYRFTWTGDPTTAPAIATRRKAGGGLTIYASWNGATQIASWRILGGAATNSLKLVGWAPQHGFETQVPIAGPMPVIEAQALDIQGHVIGTSVAIHF